VLGNHPKLKQNFFHLSVDTWKSCGLALEKTYMYGTALLANRLQVEHAHRSRQIAYLQNNAPQKI
jgi:hypothetical protein